ncbi:membrane protein insertion efficiency factor YidD [Arthrobacter sp. JSM 101049]|uniref:membrane protein insertion efficiency factor YidD n=1 Tax=Arthrobacter sp. JSM 101049 TaxID=929097 RepID=UPI003565F762
MDNADSPRQQSPIRVVLDLPRNLLIGLIIGYRKIVSPLYGDVCRYFPSCSAYALEAVTAHGALKGTALAAWRVARCNPWSHGGIDHVPEGHRIWPEGKTPKIMVLNHPPIPIDDDAAARHEEHNR